MITGEQPTYDLRNLVIEDVLYEYIGEIINSFPKEYINKIEVVDLREVIEDYDFSGIEDEEENTIDIIINYIGSMTFEETINKDILIELSKSLYKEAIDEALCVGDD